MTSKEIIGVIACGALALVSLFVFSYLIVMALVIGAVLLAADYVRRRWWHQSTKAKGRVIEHDGP